MKIHPGFVGIDVSKRHLDIFDGTTGRSFRMPNSAAALTEHLAAWQAADAFVTFEATGHYDLALRHGLEGTGVRFARVNPERARAFARAAGYLAKTDKVDARMLAAMGQSLVLPAAAPGDAVREELAGLHKRRDQLVECRKQERTRAHDAPAAILATIDRHLAYLDGAIREIEAAAAALIARNAALVATQRLLLSVPGIGQITAMTLLALMPELGQRAGGSLAVLAGLAPLADDSGDFRGQRKIRGGRKRVRDALYIAAVAASHSHSRFADFYKALRERHKPPKLAFVAVARKLLITVNAVLRDGTPFSSEHATRPAPAAA